MTQVSAPAGSDIAPAATTDQPPRVSRAAWWAGTIITTLIVLLMAVLPIVLLLTQPAMVEEGAVKQGYPAGIIGTIIVVEIACVVLYAIPQTAVLGAILLTGYLGGATATHVRLGEPWFVPVIVGALAWLGLCLRDPRLRLLLPLRRKA